MSVADSLQLLDWTAWQTAQQKLDNALPARPQSRPS